MWYGLQLGLGLVGGFAIGMVGLSLTIYVMARVERWWYRRGMRKRHGSR